MNVHVSYKVHKTPDIEKEVNHRLRKSRSGSRFSDRLAAPQSRGRGEFRSRRNHRLVESALASGQLTAEAKASSPTAAIKASFDELIQQIGRHKEVLRSSHKWRRWRGGAQESPSPAFLLSRLWQWCARPRFPRRHRLLCECESRAPRTFRDRELHFRRADNEIPFSEDEDGLSTSEVVNEVIARASATTTVRKS